MNADTHSAGHGHGAHDAAGHGSMKGYLTGFVLAVLLTVVPFWLVMGNPLGNALVTGILVMLLAVVQVVVHMVYFLHLNSRAEGGWNMLALIFTLIIVVIAISGSLWVMYNLNINMMPGDMMSKQMPSM